MSHAFSAITIRENPEQGVILHTENIARNADSFFNQGYAILQCETIQLITIRVSGKVVDVYFDESGKLKNEERVLGFVLTDDDGNQWDLAGNLLITQEDSETPAFSNEQLRDLFTRKILQPARIQTLH